MAHFCSIENIAVSYSQLPDGAWLYSQQLGRFSLLALFHSESQLLVHTGQSVPALESFRCLYNYRDLLGCRCRLQLRAGMHRVGRRNRSGAAKSDHEAHGRARVSGCAAGGQGQRTPQPCCVTESAPAFSKPGTMCCWLHRSRKPKFLTI